MDYSFIFTDEKKDFEYMESTCYLIKLMQKNITSKYKSVEIEFDERKKIFKISGLQGGKEYYMNILASNSNTGEVITYKPVKIFASMTTRRLKVALFVFLIIMLILFLFAAFYVYRKYRIKQIELNYVEDLNESYPEADVSIPCIRIIDVDESDKSDIKVYGDFYIFNYNLAGDTLTCASGGDYPGVMHVMFDEDGYEVTKFDVVADGEDFIPSAKEIFGDKYEDFMKVESDQEDREAVRAQIISNYVFANNLDVKYYQDYGWDKQSLPEQNIDSFYSVLD